jgi:hypothetical protein
MCCFCLHLYWKPNDYLVGESVHLRDGINALMCLAQAAQLCTSTAPAESAAPAASVDDKRRRLHPAGGLERSGSF